MKPLNPWHLSVQRSAERLVEDVDRKSLTSRLLMQTIVRLWGLATTSALAVPAPRVTRHQSDDCVMFDIEWLDEESGWHLCVSVRRVLGEKPHTSLYLDGNPKTYSARSPTDDEIRLALNDYFPERKKA